MSRDAIVFDPLKLTHSSWTPESINTYFQMKVQELVRSEYVRGLGIGFSPQEVIFKGNNAKSIVLIGKDNSHVITKDEIEANRELEKIHTEALLVISGKSVPGFSENTEAPHREKGWLDWVWPRESQKEPEALEPLVKAHKVKQAELVFEETDPREKVTGKTRPKSHSIEDDLGSYPVEGPRNPPVEEIIPKIPTSSPDIIIQRLKSENAELRAQISKLSRQTNISSKPDQDISKELSKLQALEKDLRSQLEKQQARFEIQTAKLNEEINKRNIAEFQRAQAQTHLERMRSLYDDAFNKQNELQAEIDNANEEINRLRSSGPVVNSNSELEQKLSELQSQLASKTAEVLELAREKDRIQALLDNQNVDSSKITELEDKIRDLRSEFLENKSKLEGKIEENLNLQRTLREKVAELANFESMIRDLRFRDQNLGTEFNRERTKLKADITAIEGLLTDAKNDAKAAKAAVREHLRRISELERDKDNLTQENTKAKSELQAIRDDINKTKKLNDEKLSEKTQEIATLRTDLRLIEERSEMEIKRLTSRLNKAKEEKQALELKSAELNKKIQSLEIEMQTLLNQFNLEKAGLERQIMEERSKLANMQKQIKAVASRESDLNHKMIQLENAQRRSDADYQSRIRELESQAELNSKSIESKDKQIESLKETLSNLQLHQKTVLAQLNSDFDKHKRDKTQYIEKLRKEIEETNQLLKQAQEELSAEQRDNEVLRSSIDKLRKELEASPRATQLDTQTDQSIDSVSAKIMELEERVEEYTKKETVLNTELMSLSSTGDKLNQTIESLRGEISRKDLEIDRLKKASGKNEAIAKKLTEKNESLTESIDATKEDLDKKMRAAEKLEAKLKQQLEEKEKSLEKVREAELSLTQAKKALDKELAEAKDLIESLTRDKDEQLKRHTSEIEHYKQSISIFEQELAAKNRELERIKRELEQSDKEEEILSLNKKIDEMQETIIQYEKLTNSPSHQRFQELLVENENLENSLKGFFSDDDIDKIKSGESTIENAPFFQKLQELLVENENLENLLKGFFSDDDIDKIKSGELNIDDTSDSNEVA